MFQKTYKDAIGGYKVGFELGLTYGLPRVVELGVSDFVVPGNRPEDIGIIRKTLEQRGVSPTFYAPGFVAQGGSISDATKVAGNNWHAIVGRRIYKAEDIKKAALEHTSQL